MRSFNKSAPTMYRAVRERIRTLLSCSSSSFTKVETNFMDIPSEILIEILKMVPANSVCRIRCVNKTLLSIVDNTPSFVNMHTRSMIAADSPHHVQHSPQLTLMSIESGSIYSLQSLNSANAKVRGAHHQLIHHRLHFVFICLVRPCENNDTVLVFIFNPLRGEVLRLPPTQKMFWDWTGMGFDSTTNTYKILRAVRNNASVLVSHVLVLGTNEWRRIPSTPFPFNDWYLSDVSVCAFGDVHWLLKNYKRQGMQGKTHIFSFDFKKEEYFFTPNPPNYVLPTSTELHLINFRGSMAIVDATSDKSIEIWVMKDYKRKQWTRDHIIDIQKLKLGRPSIFMFSECCEWEHGILFLDKRVKSTLLLDLTSPVVTKKQFNPTIQRRGCENCTRINGIMSLNGSLLSLKSFANLDGDEEQPPIYGAWNEGEASGKNFFYLIRR